MGFNSGFKGLKSDSYLIENTARLYYKDWLLNAVTETVFIVKFIGNKEF